MSDPRDDKWEDRADRAYSEFTDRPGRTAAKWYLWVLALLVALAIIGAIIGWVGSWGGTAVRLTGPAHSEQQITLVLGEYTSMKAAAANVCDVESAAKAKPSSDDPLLIEDPALAYKATYRRLEADYDRQMNNLFEAYVTRHLPLPGSIKDLPNPAPTLKQMKAQVC